jgi:hypothetical protein
MSRSVKLSDDLVLDARIAGETFKRSAADQIEFWVNLGRSVELVLNGRQVLTLSRIGASQPLSSLIENADSPEGCARVAAVIEQQPFPHYRSYPGKRRLLERTDANSKSTVGRVVNGEFKAIRIRGQAPANGTARS